MMCVELYNAYVNAFLVIENLEIHRDRNTCEFMSQQFAIFGRYK